MGTIHNNLKIDVVSVIMWWINESLINWRQLGSIRKSNYNFNQLMFHSCLLLSYLIEFKCSSQLSHAKSPLKMQIEHHHRQHSIIFHWDGICEIWSSCDITLMKLFWVVNMHHWSIALKFESSKFQLNFENVFELHFAPVIYASSSQKLWTL